MKSENSLRVEYAVFYLIVCGIFLVNFLDSPSYNSVSVKVNLILTIVITGVIILLSLSYNRQKSVISIASLTFFVILLLFTIINLSRTIVEANNQNPMLHLAFQNLSDAAKRAQDSSGGLVELPINSQVSMSDYREHVDLPANFSPDARRLAFLQFGALVLEGPSSIVVGETSLFTATLTLDDTLLQYESSKIITTVDTGALEISRLLHAQMEGIDFEILPSSADTRPQIASPGQPIQWLWQVKGTKASQQQHLTVQVFAAAQDPVEGNPDRLVLLLPGQAKQIKVNQALVDQALSNRFLQEIVLALVGSSAVAAIISVFIARPKDKRISRLEKELQELKDREDTTKIVLPS